MVPSDAIEQIPAPGTRVLQFTGDTITFRLTVPDTWQGRAWLRTSLGHGRCIRREIVRQIDRREHPLGRCWYDVPMSPEGPGRFRLTIALTEVGHFEAKAFFLPSGGSDPLWPPGANTAVNVAPAHACCANIIYNAFVRQFGPNRSGNAALADPAVRHLDDAGYTVIPPSGTFRNLIAELDFIIGHLGCRIIQLLPIHPTPTTYARMGRFGSPYAALSFTAVDPALAEFDPKATPLEQFIELVDAVHARGARLFIDIAINHTGWAASLHESHPRWLAREADGEIETPGAWGVVWADLTRLDYAHRDLWQYVADVFLTWCRRGVDGFRCDAGYMIPLDAWRYMIARVRDQFPNVIFLLEGLGGRISVTRDLLNRADFNWAYSELFQNYDRGQIEHYLPGALEISRTDGTAVHFAETHDNNRLAAVSADYARMRTALCALLSSQGGFGFANGVEWLATEKINVHGAASLNWGADQNLVDHIRRLNALLTVHPAFFHPVELEMIQTDGNCIVCARRCTPDGTGVLVLVNLDAEHTTRAAWARDRSPVAGASPLDLLSGETVALEGDGPTVQLSLDPGQVRCLTDDPQVWQQVSEAFNRFPHLPVRALRQRLRAKALEVWRFYHGVGDLGDWDADRAAARLEQAPLEFCREMNPDGDASRTIVWQFPVDLRREVMLPPGHFLLIRAEHPFRATIMENATAMAVEESLTESSGKSFALFRPLPAAGRHKTRSLKLSVYRSDGCMHHEAALVYLTTARQTRVRKIFTRPRERLSGIHLLGTNGRGAMFRAHAHWGRLPSRYDALLAANLSPEVPEDRRILMTRMRGWMVYQGFSQEIGPDCLDAFGFDFDAWGGWQYHIPTGQGQHVVLSIGIQMIPGANAIEMVFYRHPAAGHPDRLADDRPVTLILRPDLEDRNFHDLTKAYRGPEEHYPASITSRRQGFDFHPTDGHRLKVETELADFIPEPEWQYMIHHFQDAQRGQDADADLFSPGYFSAALVGGACERLIARVPPAGDDADADIGNACRRISRFFDASPPWEPPVSALKKALNQYIVKRDRHLTVIAGYPWFLDWGRDTLIVVRGIIAAGRHGEARDIVRQFAQFEQDGTIPNMIRGDDTGNRDTSDAPLWLLRVSDELSAAMGLEAVLEMDCGGRSLLAVLRSIVQSIMAGTPNGIGLDAATGLVFSPSHFTWMDTNHPAGTPRRGYPIEIQALWQAALAFMGRVDDPAHRHRWQDLAAQVRQSILELYWDPDRGYLCDCRHARPGTPAGEAVADDALRPNQLFALTLGAVQDNAIAKQILHACQELIVPGAIRSLADRPVGHELPIVHHGVVLNDPKAPYAGIYGGDEDTRRKPAYHNGTAWTWVFPSFCEAWADCYGPGEVQTALAWLASSIRLLNHGCVGHVPEILDGDAPHQARGCDAQAWGVSELLRVWIKLHDEENE